jgi:aryl-alcohol dehydrogenase-like predicted oxidoreductase
MAMLRQRCVATASTALFLPPVWQLLKNTNSYCFVADWLLLLIHACRNSDHGNVEAALRRSLAALRLTYLDLYLIHWWA